MDCVRMLLDLINYLLSLTLIHFPLLTFLHHLSYEGIVLPSALSTPTFYLLSCLTTTATVGVIVLPLLYIYYSYSFSYYYFLLPTCSSSSSFYVLFTLIVMLSEWTVYKYGNQPCHKICLMYRVKGSVIDPLHSNRIDWSHDDFVNHFSVCHSIICSVGDSAKYLLLGRVSSFTKHVKNET